MQKRKKITKKLKFNLVSLGFNGQNFQVPLRTLNRVTTVVETKVFKRAEQRTDEKKSQRNTNQPQPTQFFTKIFTKLDLFGLK